MAGAARSSTVRILIVDDEEMDRVVGRCALEAAGHEVLYAPDGEVALRVFLTQGVDVVVTDLAMPKVNGHMLIEQLLVEDSHVPIIAVSGVNPQQLERAAACGAAVTLQKPYTPQQLLRAVDEAIRVTAQRPPGDLWR